MIISRWCAFRTSTPLSPVPVEKSQKKDNHGDTVLLMGSVMCSCHLEQPSMHPKRSMTPNGTAGDVEGRDASVTTAAHPPLRRRHMLSTPSGTFRSGHSSMRSNASAVRNPMMSPLRSRRRIVVPTAVPKNDHGPSPTFFNDAVFSGTFGSPLTSNGSWDHQEAQSSDDFGPVRYEPLQLPESFLELLANQ